MKPGDLVTLEKTGELKLTNDTDTKSYSAWKEQRFVFQRYFCHGNQCDDPGKFW